jgi:hypothetical protein
MNKTIEVNRKVLIEDYPLHVTVSIIDARQFMIFNNMLRSFGLDIIRITKIERFDCCKNNFEFKSTEFREITIEEVIKDLNRNKNES